MSGQETSDVCSGMAWSKLIMFLSYEPLISLQSQTWHMRLAAPDAGSHVTCGTDTSSNMMIWVLA